MRPTPQHAVGHHAALARLREGNHRFAHDAPRLEAISTRARRDALVGGQTPFAVVLSCSDSRAPAELVFDCGLGDLFVVRVAGNIVAPSIIGSVEFAVSTFGTELVVVMGHTRCGAIDVTLDALEGTRSPISDNVRDIVERIQPSVVELARDRPRTPELERAAMRANVRASTSHLRHGTRALEQRIASGELDIVGAEYELETGEVHFLDTV